MSLATNLTPDVTRNIIPATPATPATPDDALLAAVLGKGSDTSADVTELQ